MNTQRKRDHVDRQWFHERFSSRIHAWWTALGMLALLLAASCGSEVSGGYGGQGGIGGAGSVAGCLTGACELPNGDAIDESSARAPGNADDAFAQPIPTNAIACTQDAQCASGFCTDGVCCNRRCDDVCMACTAAKKGSGLDGVCDSIAPKTDPDNECYGGECDGNNVCKKLAGQPCTLWSQCVSNYCVDGFCCNNYCDGECSACSAAKKGDGTDNGLCGKIKTGTDPDNECNPGACNGAGACSSPQVKLPIGSQCISAAQCSSGQCADGVCCDFLCVDRACQACTAAKKGGGVDGICGPIKYDTDPDNECWGGGCNGAGECKRYMNQPCSFTSECLSNYCVDGVCCNNHCMGGCYACTAAKTGQQDGFCSPIKTGTDPDNECNPGECTATHTCSAPQTPLPLGAPCTGGPQCASGLCADGVCCNDWCLGECMACTAAKKGQGSDGTCGYVKLGLDTEKECHGGVCDGLGKCRNTNGAWCTSPDQCFSKYCVEGVCCGNICNLSCESCMASKKSSGSDGACGPIKAYTDPDNECPDPRACNGAKACGLPDGEACTLSSACISGNCIDGVCCDSTCGGGATNDCQACNVAGYVGKCQTSPVNTTCRPVAGDCDVAEVCNGITITCPTDGYAPSSQVCRLANGVCDEDDKCTGSSAQCPLLDTVKPLGTICGQQPATCKDQASCDGVNRDCPPNPNSKAGTICGNEVCTNSSTLDQMDVCDGAGTCFNGGTQNCPWSCFNNQCSIGSAIQPVSGLWYNPGRPGWFVHVSHTANENGVYVWLEWLTYRPDGSPIWYVILTQENNGKFRPVEPLYNCTWDWANDQRVLVSHGTMSLTTASSTSGVISWVLDGVAWQEPVRLYAFGQSGQTPPITGAWPPVSGPMSKGPSPTATVQGNTLMSVVPLYEMNGLPTWVVQSNASTWTNNAFNATLEKPHGVNLCPGCGGTPLYTSVNVGAMSLSGFYSSDGSGFLDSGFFGASFTPASGLSIWNRSNLPIYRLTW